MLSMVLGAIEGVAGSNLSPPPVPKSAAVEQGDEIERLLQKHHMNMVKLTKNRIIEISIKKPSAS